MRRTLLLLGGGLVLLMIVVVIVVSAGSPSGGDEEARPVPETKVAIDITSPAGTIPSTLDCRSSKATGLLARSRDTDAVCAKVVALASTWKEEGECPARAKGRGTTIRVRGTVAGDAVSTTLSDECADKASFLKTAELWSGRKPEKVTQTVEFAPTVEQQRAGPTKGGPSAVPPARGGSGQSSQGGSSAREAAEAAPALPQPPKSQGGDRNLLPCSISERRYPNRACFRVVPKTEDPTPRITRPTTEP